MLIAGLQRRLFVLVILVLLSVVGFFIVSSVKEQQDALVKAGDRLEVVARLSALGAERHVEGTRQLLNAVTSGPSLKNSGLNLLCNEFLANIRSGYPYYTNLAFLDAQGEVVCHALKTEPPKGNYNDRSYFARALEQSTFAMGNFQMGLVTGLPSVGFGMPVFDQEAKLKGVAYAALEVTQLALTLKGTLPPAVSVTLTDRQGTILGVDPSQPAGRVGTQLRDSVLVTAQKMLPGQAVEAPDPSGVMRLYAVAAVADDTGPGLYVVASISRDAVTAPAWLELRGQLLWITSVVLLGILLARWIAQRTLVEPTRQLIRKINDMGQAETTGATAPPVGRDEIRSVSSAFDKFAQLLNARNAERDKQQTALEKAQASLLDAQRICKIGNWELDLTTRKLWWSHQTYVLFGRRPDAEPPVFDQLPERIFPEDLPRYEAAKNDLLSGKRTLDLEVRVVTQSGRVRWFHALGEMQGDEPGQARVCAGTIQDITERVINERLLATEARALKALSLDTPLKAVLDELLIDLEPILPGAHIAISLLSPDGKHLRQGAAPHVPAEFTAAVEGLAIGPGVGSCGTAAYLKETVVVADISASPLWVNFSDLALSHGFHACWSIPVLNPSGAVMATFAAYYQHTHQPSPEELALAHSAAHVIGVAVELNRKEAALRASELRFRNSFQGAATGMAMSNLDGRFMQVNNAFCQMMGYSAQELLGMDMQAVTYSQDWPQHHAQLMALVAGDLDSFVIEKRCRTKAGALVWVRVSMSPLRNADGQAEGFIGIAEDINQTRETAVALRQVQDALNSASRVSRLGAWSVDVTCADLVVQLSDIACEIHRLPPGTVLTTAQAIAAYSPDDAPIIGESFDACAKDGLAFDHELCLVNSAGKQVWVRSIGEAVRDGNGQVVRVQGSIQDISARKLAELAQTALQTRLTTTLDNISDGFATIDRDWRLSFVNRRAEQMLQRDRTALVGQLMQVVFPVVEGTSFVGHYIQAIRKKQAVHFEEYYAPLGLWLNLSVYPSADGLAIYFRDVTRQRLANEQLRLLETAVSRLNDIVLITEAEPFDEPGPRIVFVNDAFERRTGYSRDEVLGKTPRLLQGPNTQRAELDRIGHELRQWQPVRAELINYTKSGQQFWLELDIVPIANAEGWYTHWVAVERDITERKQAQLEMLELNAELENRVQVRTAQLEVANRELEAFSYSVSHDLRSPLNTVNGFGQLLQKSHADHLSDKGKHYLNRIRAGTQQMGELIEGLLSLAKLSRNTLILGMVDLSAMALRVEQELREREPERQVSVHIQPGLQVHGDATLLMVVMQNLLGNAWKYTSKQADAWIEIGTQPTADGDAVYFVRDNGAGFDMAHANKLFGAFQRLHAPTDFAGTGVGLANVKRVIERHGGRVWAEGHLNEGATFFFTLDVRDA